MSGQRKGGRPLVAEKRYARDSARTGGPTGSKSGAKSGTKSGGTSGGRAPKAAGSGRSGGGLFRRRARTRRAARPRGLVGWLLAPFAFALRLVWGVGWRATLAIAAFIGLGVAYYASTLPPIESLVDGRARGSVTMLDRNGDTFAWRGEQFGGMVTTDTVSPHLRNAVVATEDRRFYWHPGIDPQGVAGAIRINISEGRGPLEGNGGSTVTQQTAKLLCLGRPFDPAEWENEAEYEADCRRTTLWRKVQEAVYAMAMEVRYTKAEILTIYLNRAYLGAGTRGFEAAAQRYFGKSAAEVSPAEAAMLAGLLKAPSSYAPTSSLQRAQDRAAVVVGLMAEQGYLSQEAAAEALASPARLSERAQQDSGGFFADWVMDTGPAFFTRDTTEDVIIRTTLDQRIQKAAEDALIHVFDTQVRDGSDAQAAIVVMGADGAVRAMVGGRNIDATGAFNRATQALRQTGSSFKPFVFAAALDMGMSPLDMVDDSPLTIDIPGSGPWSPENYDRRFDGPVTLIEALEESRNIPAVRLAMQAGLENVRTVAEMFGIGSDLEAVPSMALGANESTLVEMTGAYAGILNGGSSVTPYGLVELRLQGDPDPLMGAGGGIGERVISERAARELVWMMHNVVENGTGQRARIEGRELAGKTGTTSAARDAWFIGFSGDYVAGVWMGYDDNTPLTGVTGAGLPAAIWHETMSRILEGQAAVPLPMDAPTGAGEWLAQSGQGLPGQGLPGQGLPGQTPSDPALDAALREAFGAPVAQGTVQAQSGNVDPGQPAPPPSQQPNRTEDAILDVLGDILGGG